ncbi:MAG: hypothetical protein BZY82_00175 [SAR202 cluster bacterium Io17-Chloro-G3]|nr:MAG: hypothetical protein BZY82_00175 [SAR202 cluster bacterium Io17-Chloro-G3]
MSLTFDQNTLLGNLIETALTIQRGTGKAFTEFTGIIGELSICKDQNFTWEPNKGFDAREKEPGARIQIKTRRSTTEEEVNRAGRIGRFTKANESQNLFDVGVLVILNKDFEITAHYHLRSCHIKVLESFEEPDSGLHVSTFQNFASLESLKVEGNSCNHKTDYKKTMRKTQKALCRLKKLELNSEPPHESLSSTRCSIRPL